MAARKKPATKAKRIVKKKITKVKALKATPKSKKAAPAKAKAVAKKSAAISVGRKPFSKSELISTLCEQTGVARKEIVSVMNAIPEVIKAHLYKSGPEMFTWPGLFKIVIVKKPATKAREGISPFTGEMMTFKAKPASRRIKVRALKQLKGMVA